ncbi:hypothetical protein FKP32DRAFT_1598151 [Trametes sanguinea]|nr:hypothetical protein FKP32DRAFT_1598151 [Trametes sanguinea]
MKKAVAGFILTAFSARYANADVTTLYIPGYDPQAVTADIEGIDASGHTTWRLGPGVPSGTFTADRGMVSASVTLVEGPSDAHLVESDSTLSFLAVEDCGFSRGIALCTISGHAQDESLTDTVTETISGFAVQFGGVPATLTAARTSDGTSTTTSSSTGVTMPMVGKTASGGSGMGGGTLPSATEGQGTTSGTATPTATRSSANGAEKLRACLPVTVVGLATMALVLNIV